MISWIHYRVVDGAIVGRAIRRTIPFEGIVDGKSYIPSDADIHTNYVLNGEITQRPLMELNLPIEGFIGQEVTFSNIPIGCTVTTPGGQVIVDDQVLEWESAVSGRFKFKFELFPYMTEEHTVEIKVQP